ncbi:type IV pili methyl-accepting chemotaxis transducer N-terminal domain-containing protein [Ideonella sp. B7]|uniref:type IV pili methyl-accepting chemotaxis transducer N-terminal domain-containing protein n=1 Tax=Ideonella benzenivorans TaxID=2831643 RepID=UPI001CED37F0|nr:type IV pili methyl-accepting chemotaxis transducer N-terminal domain-containing protein [Ideonella benzenivorans]MCA6218172.1 type IV pili methyl-accepting chemotaxis transducer N-terminal domain-containing protein [Ideonella benzenivorans]
MSTFSFVVLAGSGDQALLTALAGSDPPVRCEGLDALRLRQDGASDAGTAPVQIVLTAEAWPAQGLAALNGPVSCVGELPAAVPPQTWLDQGLTGWWPRTVLQDPALLRRALQWDAARWTHEQALRTAQQQQRRQLEERIWVDKAKGVLMNARGISEDEAFRLLRGASMHANLRLGDLSRSVIEAAQWAEAVNRAGQLRMLSQRLVKLAAQRQAAVEVKRARAAQDEAARRLQDNLAHLAGLPMLEAQPAALRDALQGAESAWAALRQSLAGKPGLPLLAEADARAEALLQAAETLTAALEAGGARGGLRIVNLCGRQRMRVQRLAKQALLAGLLSQPERLALLPALMDDFEATLRELEQAPLSTPDIRETLGAARDEWLRLLRALRGGPGIDVQGVLAASSDALLDLFHRLTDSYERSLQLIMS